MWLQGNVCGWGHAWLGGDAWLEAYTGCVLSGGGAMLSGGRCAVSGVLSWGVLSGGVLSRRVCGLECEQNETGVKHYLVLHFVCRR